MAFNSLNINFILYINWADLDKYVSEVDTSQWLLLWSSQEINKHGAAHWISSKYDHTWWIYKSSNTSIWLRTPQAFDPKLRLFTDYFLCSWHHLRSGDLHKIFQYLSHEICLLYFVRTKLKLEFMCTPRFEKFKREFIRGIAFTN